MATKMVRLEDFLTDAEIVKVIELYAQYGVTHQSTFVAKMVETILRPNLERINASLGQENDPRYIAYATLFVLSNMKR